MSNLITNEYNNMNFYIGDYMKRNRKITVEVEGTITDEMRREYHHILADSIVAQYGVGAAKQILEGLKKEGLKYL
ncbi:MAG: hypothetical protein LLF98_00785 [Clostridium sp.]|nr:hypothetical protein [Clostridium sp.]